MSSPRSRMSPGRRAIQAGHDVDAGRFARAVRADQRMHGAAPHREIDPVERLQPAEILGQAGDFHRRVLGSAAPVRASSGNFGTGPTAARRRGMSVRDEAPHPIRQEDHDQDHRGAVDGEIDLLQEAQPFRQHDQQHGAEQRAERRLHAAQQRHGQKHDRFIETELVRADVGEGTGEQRTADAAEHGTEAEGDHLGAEHGDAAGARGEFVVAHRLHGAAEPARLQPPGTGT